MASDDTPDVTSAETSLSGQSAPDRADSDLDAGGPRPGLSAMVWIPLLSLALMAGLVIAGWHSFAL